jgi:hypothetical protein
MTNCEGCRFADWKRTKSGALHPDKSGKCTRLDVHPLDQRLPVAFYWLGSPKPCGGYIERGRVFDRKCEFKDGSK